VIKLICFVKRNPSLSVEEFHRHWREDHARIIVDTPDFADRIVRYEQNHRLPADYEQGDDRGFDGVAIQWFESPDDFVAMISSDGYRDRVAPDEAVLLDGDGLAWMLTDVEHAPIPGPEARDDGLCKVHTLLRRRSDLSTDAFRRYWRDVHGPLFRDTPALAQHVVRYEQNHRVEGDLRNLGSGEFDGVAIQWLRSPEDLVAMATEPAYAEKVAPDNQRFLDDVSRTWILTGPEEVVIG
jgi:hypothetical protein